MKWLLAAAILLLAVPGASAQPCDPLPNGIGIYFDEQGCSYCTMPAPYAMITGYVLVTNLDPDLGGISGYEFKLLCEPYPLPWPLTVIPEGLAPLVITFPFYQGSFSAVRRAYAEDVAAAAWARLSAGQSRPTQSTSSGHASTKLFSFIELPGRQNSAVIRE